MTEDKIREKFNFHSVKESGKLPSGSLYLSKLVRENLIRVNEDGKIEFIDDEEEYDG